MQQLFLLGSVKPLPYFYLVTSILAVLFTFIGPETNHPFFIELVLWLFQTIVPLTFILVSHLLLSQASWFNYFGNIQKLVLSGLTGVILYMPLAIGVDAVSGEQVLPPTFSDWPTALIDELTGVAPPVIIGWLALNAPWLLGYKFEKDNALPVESSRNDDLTAHKLKFFPEDLNEVLYLKSELHYLLVVTTNGRTLELFNLKDAIAVLHAIDGLQPHRSWWINTNYIDYFKAQGREGKLVLKDASEIPVSRRRMNDVREKLTGLSINSV